MVTSRIISSGEIRRKSRQTKRSTIGEDSILGKSRAKVAILLGIRYDNHRYAREYIPITDNAFTKTQNTTRNFTSNPRALPHILELFPTSLWKFQKKYDNLAKLYVLQQINMMNLPDVSGLQDDHCIQCSSWVVCSDKNSDRILPTAEDYEETDMYNNTNVNNTTKCDDKTYEMCEESVAVYQNNYRNNSVKVSEYPEQSGLNMSVFYNQLNNDEDVSKIEVCKSLLRKVLAKYNSENNEAANIVIDTKDNNFADVDGVEYYNSNHELDEAITYKEALIADLKDESFKCAQRLISSDLVEEMHKIMSTDPTMQSGLLQYYNEEMLNQKSVFLSSANLSFQQVLKQPDPKMVEYGLQAIEKE